MSSNRFGQQAYGQQQAPQRRGLFGNVRWWILLLFAGYAAFSWFGSKQTDPYTGESAHYGATPQEESELGTQAYQQVLGDAQAQRALLPANDPTSQQIRQIAQRLVARVPQVAADLAALHNQPTPDLSSYQWDVNVIQSEEANAFCLPGGKIAVYTGLIPVAKNADAMAVVMGHEIAHALLRHGAQRMAQQKLVQMGQMAAGVAWTSRPCRRWVPVCNTAWSCLTAAAMKPRPMRWASCWLQPPATTRRKRCRCGSACPSLVAARVRPSSLRPIPIRPTASSTCSS